MHCKRQIKEISQQITVAICSVNGMNVELLWTILWILCNGLVLACFLYKYAGLNQYSQKEGGGCVCVSVCLCKSTRTKWLKVSHTSAKVWMKICSKRKEASCWTVFPQSRKEQGEIPQLILLCCLLQSQAVPAVDGNINVVAQWVSCHSVALA